MKTSSPSTHIRPGLRRSSYHAIIDWALIAQLTAICLLFIWSRQLLPPTTPINIIIWTMAISLWLFHFVSRLVSNPMFSCLRSSPMSLTEATAFASRYCQSAPIMELSMNGNVRSGESGRFFRPISWDRWVNGTHLTGIEWPPGISLVSVIEDVQPGDQFTRLRIDVQSAKFKADCRRQYGTVAMLWGLHLDISCGPLDESRQVMIGPSEQRSWILSPNLYAFMTLIGLSTLWDQIINLKANRMDLVVLKNVYIDRKGNHAKIDLTRVAAAAAAAAAAASKPPISPVSHIY